jgi:cytochrome o ubiquinol oxidase operon protein cyoD
MNEYNAHELPRPAELERSYVLGFAISLACTVGAYAVARAGGAHALKLGAIALLALVQALAQITLFLHVSFARRSRLKLAVFGFTVLVMFIVVAGSLWIMNDLNGRMTMDEGAMTQYMQDQGGF